MIPLLKMPPKRRSAAGKLQGVIGQGLEINAIRRAVASATEEVIEAEKSLSTLYEQVVEPGVEIEPGRSFDDVCEQNQARLEEQVRLNSILAQKRKEMEAQLKSREAMAASLAQGIDAQQQSRRIIDMDRPEGLFQVSLGILDKYVGVLDDWLPSDDLMQHEFVRRVTQEFNARDQQRRQAAPVGPSSTNPAADELPPVAEDRLHVGSESGGERVGQLQTQHDPKDDVIAGLRAELQEAKGELIRNRNSRAVQPPDNNALTQGEEMLFSLGDDQERSEAQSAHRYPSGQGLEAPLESQDNLEEEDRHSSSAQRELVCEACTRLEKQLSEAENNAQQIDESLRVTRESLDETSKQLQQRIKEASVLREKLSLEKPTDSDDDELSILRGEEYPLEKEYKKQKRKRRDYKKRLREADKAFESLEQELESDEEFDGDRQKQANKWLEKLARVESAIDQAILDGAELGETRTAKRDLEVKLAEARTANKDLEVKIVEAESQLDKYNAEYSTFASRKQSTDEQAAEVQRQMQDLDTLRNNSTRLQELADNLGRDVASLTPAKKKLEGEVTTLKTELNSVRGEAQEAKDKASERASTQANEVQTLTEKLSTANESIGNLTSQKDARTAEVSQLKEQLRQTEEKLGAANAHVSEGERINADIVGRESSLEEETASLERQKASLSTREANVVTAYADITRREEAYKVKEHTMEEMRQSLEAEDQTLKAAAKKAQEELKSEQTLRQTAEAAKDVAESAGTALQQKLKDTETARDDLQNMKDALGIRYFLVCEFLYVLTPALPDGTVEEIGTMMKEVHRVIRSLEDPQPAQRAHLSATLVVFESVASTQTPRFLLGSALVQAHRSNPSFGLVGRDLQALLRLCDDIGENEVEAFTVMLCVLLQELVCRWSTEMALRDWFAVIMCAECLFVLGHPVRLVWLSRLQDRLENIHAQFEGESRVEKMLYRDLCKVAPSQDADQLTQTEVCATTVGDFRLCIDGPGSVYLVDQSSKDIAWFQKEQVQQKLERGLEEIIIYFEGSGPLVAPLHFALESASWFDKQLPHVRENARARMKVLVTDKAQSILNAIRDRAKFG